MVNNEITCIQHDILALKQRLLEIHGEELEESLASLKQGVEERDVQIAELTVNLLRSQQVINVHLRIQQTLSRKEKISIGKICIVLHFPFLSVHLNWFVCHFYLNPTT